TSAHARQPVLARVDAATRLRDSLQVRDHALAAAAVLEIDHERLVRVAVLDAVIPDVALLLEQAGDLLLHPRVRHLHVVVERSVRVPYATQHVCNWIRQHGLLLYLPSEAIGTNQLDGKCGAFFIVTTRNSWSCR